VGTLQMEWCLDCHRPPEKFIRPREQVYNLSYDPQTDQNLDKELGVSTDKAEAFRTQEALGPQLVKAYHIHKEQLTNCSICHR
jgi:hypothetical protein